MDPAGLNLGFPAEDGVRLSFIASGANGTMAAANGTANGAAEHIIKWR